MRYFRMLFFWITFPMSFPSMIIIWFAYRGEYIDFDDLVDAFRHFYLGSEEV